jgi:hypothetical protein
MTIIKEGHDNNSNNNKIKKKSETKESSSPNAKCHINVH